MTWPSSNAAVAGVREIPRLLGCNTQMASSGKANLLDDGVVDTLGLVGATSGVHASSGGANRAQSDGRARNVGLPAERATPRHDCRPAAFR
jgi:hypothetical protein